MKTVVTSLWMRISDFSFAISPLPVFWHVYVLMFQGGNSNHEAMSNEWLQTGNCPIAKSFRAVSGVLPLVAKVFQPPPGMKYKCPPVVVAARAAIARTAFAKNLRPQPLPAKVLVIGMLGMAANVPLGIWREHTEKFSVSWFAAVHAAVPFIAMLRKSVLMPKSAMAFTIAASVLGQVIGSRAERHRMKAISQKRVALEEKSVGIANQVQIVAVNGGHCGEPAKWDSVSLQVANSSSSADVFCWSWCCFAEYVYLLIVSLYPNFYRPIVLLR